MSHSYKKTPICGLTCAESDKPGKTLYNRRYRRVIRHLLQSGMYDLLPLVKELYNAYNLPKDGKKYYDGKSNYRKEALRK